MAEIITVAVIAADTNHIAYVATVNQREGRWESMSGVCSELR
ncbi:MAG: hypothetical protein RL473_386, partial [Actinomycetota bacterium]